MSAQSDTEGLIGSFIRQQQLPDEFVQTAEQHYLPLASRLQRMARDLRIVGINGAQGTGKSTLALFLQQVLEAAGWNVVIVSIDDMYLTCAERQDLAARVHPLLRTRGVPGTHDTELLSNCLDQLCALPDGATMRVPRFDKSRDERFPEACWEEVSGAVDLVILEGWCVGSSPQAADQLIEPVNALERQQDESSSWRNYVNSQLQGPYASVFARIDYLAFLQAPDFDSVFRWRLEQERKLGETESAGAAVMNDNDIAAFIQHYERLTRHNLVSVPQVADAVLELDRDHRCQSSYYR